MVKSCSKINIATLRVLTIKNFPTGRYGHFDDPINGARVSIVRYPRELTQNFLVTGKNTQPIRQRIEGNFGVNSLAYF